MDAAGCDGGLLPLQTGVIVFKVEFTATPEKAILEMIGRLTDMTPAMAEIAENSITAIKLRITTTKMSPDGDPWTDWRPMTVRSRRRRGTISQGILWDTGNLLNSIHARILPKTVAIGSNAEYAKELQKGNPANYLVGRPFIGWSLREVEFAAMAITEWVNAAHIVA